MKVIDEKNQLLSVIYIASGKGRLLRKGKQTMLKEGKSYWIKEASILTWTSEKIFSVYKLSWWIELKKKSTV